jgi:CRP-like cAMP-binding protein
MSVIPLMQKKMKEKANSAKLNGFAGTLSARHLADEIEGVDLEKPIVGDDTANSFWKGIHNHHQNAYVVNKGVMAHITEITQDARSHAKMEENERIRKAAGRFLLPKVYLINPRHKYKVGWDVYIGAVILYSAIVIPYSIGFSVEFPDDTAIGGLNIFFDLCFGLDLIFSFNMVYYDDVHGNVITNRWQIAKQYLSTWFSIDFFSTLPIDRIAIGVMGREGGSSARSIKLIRTLRLFRLTKLVRVFKLKKFAELINDLEINQGFISLGNLMFRIIFCAHLLACFWNLTHVNAEPGMNTWSLHFGVSPSADVGEHYVAALYWTAATMMGVGYGDVYAVNSWERAYSILAQIVGAFTFGYILATMTIFYESSDPRTAKIDAHIDELKSYMHERKLPKKLQNQVLMNFQYRYQTKSIFAEKEILAELSTHLADEVTKNGYAEIISRFPFLKTCRTRFVTSVMLNMKPVYIEENDVLYYQGRMSPGLFLLREGMVIATAVLGESKLPKTPSMQFMNKNVSEEPNPPNNDATQSRLIGVFQAGSHFGHETFCTKKASLSYFRAAANSDVLMVPCEDMEHLLAEASHIFDDLNKDGAALYENLQTVVGIHNRIECIPPGPVDPEQMPDLKVVFNGQLRGYGHKRRTLTFAKVQSSKKLFKDLDPDGDIDITKLLESTRETLYPCMFPPSRRHSLPSTDMDNVDVEDLEDTDDEEEEDQDEERKIARRKSSWDGESLSQVIRHKSTHHDVRDKMVTVNLTAKQILNLGFVHPQYNIKQRFDILIGMLIIYSVVAIPYQIAFDIDSEAGWLVFDWTVDILFAVDICVTAKTPYMDPEKRTYICANRMIVEKYVKSWFAIDFFSTVPIDKIAASIALNNSAEGDDGKNLKLVKLIKTLRLIRLLKLARVLKLGKIQDSLEDIFDSPNTFKLLKLCLMLFGCAHMIGCAWFAVSPKGTPPHEAWWGQLEDLQYEQDNTEQLYLASLYWAFTTMTTVGYGDITPVTTSERLLAIVIMLFGATIFGYVIGNVAATTMSNDIAQARKEDKMKEVSSYLKEKGISRSLKKKVENFFTYFFENRSAFDENELLEDLPSSTRNRIYMHLYGDIAAKFSHSILKGIRRSHACFIMSNMRPQVYSPKDIVYREGDPGQAIYLIQQGVIEELRYQQADKINRTYFEGSYFGEKALMLNIERLNTVRARTMATLLILSKHTIGNLVDKSGDISNSLNQMLVSTVKLTISREQQSRAKENSGFKSKVNSKVYSLLLSKAKVIRGRTASGRSRNLTRTHSAFNMRKKKTLKKSSDEKETEKGVDTLFEDIHAGTQEEFGEDITGGEADAGAGGGAPR